MKQETKGQLQMMLQLCYSTFSFSERGLTINLWIINALSLCQARGAGIISRTVKKWLWKGDENGTISRTVKKWLWKDDENGTILSVGL